MVYLLLWEYVLSKILRASKIYNQYMGASDIIHNVPWFNRFKRHTLLHPFIIRHITIIGLSIYIIFRQNYFDIAQKNKAGQMACLRK